MISLTVGRQHPRPEPESGTSGVPQACADQALRPTRRIDGIFVDAALRVVSCGVLEHPELTRASDHRPVLAVLAR